MATPPSKTNEENVNPGERDRARMLFPVTSSLLSAKALLTEVMTDYALSQPVACQLLRRGLSDTYLVRTLHDPYILRIYRPTWRSVSEILYEMDMLSYLRQHGAPVSAPLRRKDGSFIHGLSAPEGIRYMALFTYAKGEEPSLSAEQGIQMGVAMAAIHQASEGFSSQYARFPLDVDHLIHIPLRLAEPYLRHRPEDVAFLSRLANALSKHILSLAPRLDWGICHGDGTERNAHITNEVW
jgi:Ser/Thr protein kinase RdoA (MazF antagonist)